MRQVRLFLASVGRRPALYSLVTPPMGLLYLAAYLRAKFHVAIRIEDQRLSNCTDDELVQAAVDFRADVVGLSAFTSGAHALSRITANMRRALPQVHIALGGPHASASRADALLGNAADIAVEGEGEWTFERAIRADFDPEGLAAIPGLHWRNAEGRIVTNPGLMPLIPDLDTLPFPAYDLIDIRQYWKQQSMPPIPRRTYISLTSSRGCPYQCIWCHKIFGKRHRAHSAERIVDEIVHFARSYGVDEVEFLDDTFTQDPDRVMAFSELLLRKHGKIKIAFPNAIRGDTVTPEMLRALRDAGVYFSSFALETGSPRLQQYTCKFLNIPRFLENVETAVKLGIFANGFAMLGFPTETEAELQQTIDVAAHSQLHTCSFFTVTPYPNTELYAIVERERPEKLAKISYNDLTFPSIRVNLTDLPDETLFAYQRKANWQFFLKPGRAFRILRDYPKPHLLPAYLPVFFSRATKGLFHKPTG